MNELVQETRRRLRAGEVIEVEGMRVRGIPGFTCLVDHDEYPDDDCPGTPDYLKPGDWYVAGRNTGPHLLTVREVHPTWGWVFPETTAYPFNSSECVKVDVLWEEETA